MTNKIKESGFTLIELMIIGAIIAILITIAYPNISKYMEERRSQTNSEYYIK